jgi:Cof subfamily protein (haloacid dehalogenase superfamily)
VGGVRLVALDVDGTVLDERLQVADSTRAAVAEARERGVHVVLASSRGPEALAFVQEALGLRDEWFVGYQGALVARRKGDARDDALDAALDVLAETRMALPVARAVEEAAVARGLSVGRYAGLRWRVPEVTDAIRREAATTGETPVPGAPDERDADGPPHKVLVIAPDDDRIADLHALADALPPEVTATFSHRTYLEVTAAGVDKASGLGPLLDALALDADATAAVGDGANDLALFRAVGCAIAMGQAADEVRAAASWVTGTVWDDGVARALAYLGVAPAPDTPERGR